MRICGPPFNIKMSSYQYRKSHCGDKTVVRSSYLHNGISYTGNMISLYWTRALILKTVLGVESILDIALITVWMRGSETRNIRWNMTLCYVSHSILYSAVFMEAYYWMVFRIKSDFIFQEKILYCPAESLSGVLYNNEKSQVYFAPTSLFNVIVLIPFGNNTIHIAILAMALSL